MSETPAERAQVHAEEAFRAAHPRWKLSFEYGDYYAVHDNYDASWEGEEDGWVDNGLQTSARTIEDLELEIACIEEERGL
jgi:hypothetical protein